MWKPVFPPTKCNTLLGVGGGANNLSVWNVRLAHFWVVCAINAIFVCLYRGGALG